MTSITCPHCGATNATDASFCESCGKALPDPLGDAPRVLATGELAATDAGRMLQADELSRQTKKAAGAILAVAVLQAIVGTFVLLFARQLLTRDPDAEIDTAMIVVIYAIAVAFFGLYLWARKDPLPAAIVALVLFVTVHALDAVVDPSAIVRGIIMKVIIILMLARAISAGTRHRKLMQEMRAS